MNPTATFTTLLMRLWHHLSRHRQRQFVLLMGLMLASAFAEVVSLGAVLPFLGILTAPDLVFNHPIVAPVARALGFTSADQLVLPLTVGFALATLAALVAGALLACEHRPQGWQFVCLDARLSGAAEREGFSVIPQVTE